MEILDELVDGTHGQDSQTGFIEVDLIARSMQKNWRQEGLGMRLKSRPCVPIANYHTQL